MTVIGTLHKEEARVFDSAEGYHQFENEDGEQFGSFEVFWHDGGHMIEQPEHDDMPLDDWREPEPAGWYWQASFPGCLNDGEPQGPFSYSWQAKDDANDF